MLKLKKQINLLRNLSKFLLAKVPIEKSLILSGFPDFVIGLVKQGTPLYIACKDILPQKILSFLQIGQITGELPKSVELACKTLLLQEEQKQSIQNALLYPIFVFAFLFIAVIFFSFYIIPQIKLVFLSMEIKDTSILSFIEFCGIFLMLLVVTFLFLVVVYKLLNKIPKGNYFFERIIMYIPFLGEFYKKILLSRFLYDISMLLGAGIPIDKSLSVLEDSTYSLHFKKTIYKMKFHVERGKKFSEAMSLESFISDFCVKMCILGEETGNLASCLFSAAEIISEELKNTIKVFSFFIEPIATILIGVFTCAIIFSMFSPISVMIDKMN